MTSTSWFLNSFARPPIRSILLCVVFFLFAGLAAAQGNWTPVYNDGCSGEGHRVLVGEITTRAALGDGCDLVAGYVAPDQRYAGEWVWGYSPTGGAVTGATAGDAAYFRPHICDVLPPFPWSPDAGWQTRVVEPQDYLYALYGPRYPAYIAASCRLRAQNPEYARIGLDRALRPGSKLAEPPEELVTQYNREVLQRERVAIPVPTGRLTMVFPGDSVGLFAQIFDVPSADIQAANTLADPSALLVGQMLLIPGESLAPTASERVAPRWPILCRLAPTRVWATYAGICV